MATVTMVVTLVLVLGAAASASASTGVPTTTKTYELQVPGSSSIRIIEAEPPWAGTTTTERYRSEFEHRAFGKPGKQNAQQQAKFSPDALKQFLKSYAERLAAHNARPDGYGDDGDANGNNNELKDADEEPRPDGANKRHYDDLIEVGGGDDDDYEESPKNWDVMKVQRHKHPYDDKKGWVTLEAVPWSVSKVSKWHSNVRPQAAPRPWDGNDYEESTHRPFYGAHQNGQRPFTSYQIKPAQHFDYNSGPGDDDGDYFEKRPGSFYAQKVYMQQSHSNRPEEVQRPSWNKKRPYVHHAHDEDYGYEPDIITDGRPSNFPHHLVPSGSNINNNYYNPVGSSSGNNNRRRGSGPRPNAHPFSGDGDWVLVSTTKGYKYPKNRERAMHTPGDSVGAHRTVRLTVLPPLKDSKVNMTTSHGGLLQVESTFKTVEQEQKALADKQAKQKPQATKRPNRVRPSKSKPQQGDEEEARITANTFTTRKDPAADSSAVLAAVGAGMIPATMAMLVPMALNGRRRRRRSLRYAASEPGGYGFGFIVPRSM